MRGLVITPLCFQGGPLMDADHRLMLIAIIVIVAFAAALLLFGGR